MLITLQKLHYTGITFPCISLTYSLFQTDTHNRTVACSRPAKKAIKSVVLFGSLSRTLCSRRNAQ
jgi:hypothetical protein